jgi:hypothetical protein
MLMRLKTANRQAELAGLAALLSGVMAAPVFADEGDDEALPDMAFLEYLGSWETSDEEWTWLADDDELPADGADRNVGEHSDDSDDAPAETNDDG